MMAPSLMLNCFWAGQPSHTRENWLAHAPHLPNVPYLPCRLVLVPCLLLEAPSCSSLGLLRGTAHRYHRHDLAKRNFVEKKLGNAAWY